MNNQTVGNINPIFIDKPVRLNQELQLLHMNIRSIYHNFEELQLLISSFETLPVAICLTEIWLRKDDTLESFRLDGYQKPLLVSHSNKSSGAAIYLLDEYVP